MLDVRWPTAPSPLLVDLVAARLDDFAPGAVHEDPPTWHVCFAKPADRDAAQRALVREFSGQGLDAIAHDLPDENWAARSQARLRAVVVDGVIVAPPWDRPETGSGRRIIDIEPSVGFGTGHHASTRLCLRALQRLPLASRSVLDVGTGSGLLAIAAALAGAHPVDAIDVDADAVGAARANAVRNGVADRLRWHTGDVRATSLSPADVVFANLTGVLLLTVQTALLALVRPGGHLVASGFTTDERVARPDGPFLASGALRPVADYEEDGWRCLVLCRG